MIKTRITDKTIKIYSAIINAGAIQLDNRTIVKLDYCHHPKMDADNEVLWFKWNTFEDVEYCAKFTEEGLEESFIDPAYPNELILIDSEGEEFPILILSPSPVTDLVYDYER